ncbi:MAG: RNA methyltransferase [Crocinitomicaceae bacterium]|nr:RNA methyltransferase [Crocinitomicaceae bacterium]|tara:strand:+ start:3351 stop:4484 length:1134 start_codon:yes stop_codon:yes gene_type:complete
MYQVFISTYQGLEDILIEELKELGISPSRLKVSRRGVSVSGCDLKDIYTFNYLLRTALRVLINLDHLRINSANDLYDAARNIDWSEWFSVRQSFKIDAIANNSEFFRNSLYAARLVKDAIVDNFRDNEGKRPSVDFDYPDVKIHVLISGNTTTLSIDSSGESLHKRGYKSGIFRAPISEVLAAAMLKQAGFNSKMNLFDPMCGSGTILCEGYLLATNTPAGKFRRHWAFQEWKNYDKGEFLNLIDSCNANITKFSGSIYGTDLVGNNVGLTKSNLGNVGYSSGRIEKADFFESANHFNVESGLLLTNPPYGERLELSEARDFYKNMGDQFKQQFSGWTAGVFSANIPALKGLGLKPRRRIPLWNGPLEGRLFLYDLY